VVDVHINPPLLCFLLCCVDNYLTFKLTYNSRRRSFHREVLLAIVQSCVVPLFHAPIFRSVIPPDAVTLLALQRRRILKRMKKIHWPFLVILWRRFLLFFHDFLWLWWRWRHSFLSLELLEFFLDFFFLELEEFFFKLYLELLLISSVLGTSFLFFFNVFNDELS